MYSLYLMLGLEENAPDNAVEDAYKRLREQLDLARFEPGSPAYVQAQQCLLSIENAYRTLSNPQAKQRYNEEWREAAKLAVEDEIKPKLGQLCVAAGFITLEELEQAVETQGRLNLPIGQILQEQKLVSQAELDGLLLGQQIIQLPPEFPHSIGQRLIALELVSEDMVRIALIQQRTFGKRLGEMLVANGWLDPAIHKALCGDEAAPQQTQSTADSPGRKQT